jgi:hypothetical protein
MGTRAGHLVGSIPGDSPEEAMRLGMRYLGPGLHSLPDGETGERSRWIVNIIESFRDHPDLELVKDGDWSGYDSRPVYRIKKGHQLRPESLDFGLVATFDAGYPVFERVRQESGRPDLSFQVGVPGDFDMALFTLGPLGAFTKRRPFTEATVREIEAIHAKAGDDVVFQIEVPAELVFVAQMPAPIQPLMANLMARPITGLARRSPAGARFGIHLCLGDLNNKALGRMRDATPLVLLTNAIVSRWPEGRALEYVHVPLAAGDEPPSLDPSFYAPLSRLRLPDRVRLIAGIVHEGRTEEEERRILAMVDERIGRQADVAAACGLGRREHAAAEANLKLAAGLSEQGASVS